MIALGATYVVRGGKERTVAANQFYKGLYDTALARNEILTEIAFRRLLRRAAAPIRS